MNGCMGRQTGQLENCVFCLGHVLTRYGFVTFLTFPLLLL